MYNHSSIALCVTSIATLQAGKTIVQRYLFLLKRHYFSTTIYHINLQYGVNQSIEQIAHLSVLPFG